jgi:hypothetical protein
MSTSIHSRRCELILVTSCSRELLINIIRVNISPQRIPSALRFLDVLSGLLNIFSFSVKQNKTTFLVYK